MGAVNNKLVGKQEKQQNFLLAPPILSRQTRKTTKLPACSSDIKWANKKETQTVAKLLTLATVSLYSRKHATYQSGSFYQRSYYARSTQ
jgi:hypothetical protein